VNSHASAHIFSLDEAKDKNYLIEGIEERLTAANDHHLQWRCSTDYRPERNHKGCSRELSVNECRHGT
jgi:hypothetical protein